MSLSFINIGAIEAPHVNPVAETMMNISYGPDDAQRLDAYLPKGRSVSATKSLILVHGGGWNSGSRSSFASYIDSFKRRMPEYAIFNVEYRLVNSSTIFPAQENDIKAAVNFITAHANEYEINKDKLVMLGASAGAHLALLQSYKYTSPHMAAVIDFFGPADLIAMYNHPWHPMIPYLLQMITGTTPTANKGAYSNSSPVTFINSQSPPTLIFHGKEDHTVDTSQSELLYKKLQQAGVPSRLVWYDNAGHGWHGATLSNSFDIIEEFLKKYVH